VKEVIGAIEEYKSLTLMQRGDNREEEAKTKAKKTALLG